MGHHNIMLHVLIFKRHFNMIHTKLRHTGSPLKSYLYLVNLVNSFTCARDDDDNEEVEPFAWLWPHT